MADVSGSVLMSLTPMEERGNDDNGTADDDIAARLTVIPMPDEDVVLPD